MDFSNICEVVEQNSLQNSVVKFVNGSSGKVTEETIPITSWDKIVNKEMVTSTASDADSGGKKDNNASSSNSSPGQSKIRQTFSQISKLEDAKGIVITDQEKISTELVDFCEKRFAHKEVKIVEELLNVIPHSITAEDQRMLDVIPNEEEIKKIAFEMDPDSSPGPDGFSGAKTASQFRPIGLSNVSFKVITKLITTRMSTLMEKLVSPQQTTYIKGRSIHEQVLLASEMVNEMKRKRRGENVGLKLDISQAYDAMVNDYSSFSKKVMMVNGGPCGFVLVGRGLRQGDSLSPMLFILMEDVLSRNLSHLVQSGKTVPMVVRKGNASFINDIGLNAFVKENLSMKLQDLLTGKNWCIPEELTFILLTHHCLK
ncbi:uncharacterized protein LOC113305705 [Papaver somniferum]|uniref:uncharacterized protein LOC113305705 n=1 Tax=Papaver somniferum TaxID=3469 RepID=UPI000E7022B1|nr:uncharacterized protein LOC113305705 [Papaver somniferum]